MDQPAYAQRDRQALGAYYLRHVDRMTVEGLHAKSDIAGELAWRDQEIDRLRALVPVVSVDRMVETHRVTYCVQLRRGKLAHCIRQVGEAYKNRADYEADELRHLLGQGAKPRILDYPEPQ